MVVGYLTAVKFLARHSFHSRRGYMCGSPDPLLAASVSGAC